MKSEAARRMIDGQGERLQLEPNRSRPGSRHGFYYAECEVHGRTEHLTVLGGRCCKCAQEQEGR